MHRSVTALLLHPNVTKHFSYTSQHWPFSDASPSGASRGVTYLPQLQQRTQNWSWQLHAPFPGEPQPGAEGQHWVQGVLSCGNEKQQLSSSLALPSPPHDGGIKERKSNSTCFTKADCDTRTNNSSWKKIRPRAAAFLPSLLLIIFFISTQVIWAKDLIVYVVLSEIF